MMANAMPGVPRQAADRGVEDDVTLPSGTSVPAGQPARAARHARAVGRALLGLRHRRSCWVSASTSRSTTSSGAPPSATWSISLVVLVAFGYLTKFYRGRFRVGSFDEVTGLAFHFAAVGLTTALLFTMFDPDLPRSIPVLVPPIALVSAAAGRWLFRTYRDRNAPDPDERSQARPRVRRRRRRLPAADAAPRRAAPRVPGRRAHRRQPGQATPAPARGARRRGPQPRWRTRRTGWTPRPSSWRSPPPPATSSAHCRTRSPRPA